MRNFFLEVFKNGMITKECQKLCNISATYLPYFSSYNKNSRTLSKATFLPILDLILIPLLVLRDKEFLHWSFHLLLVVEASLMQEMKPCIGTSDNPRELDPVGSGIPSKSWSLFRVVRVLWGFCVVLLQKSLLSVNQYQVFLHTSTQAVRCTVWHRWFYCSKKFVKNYPIIITPDAEYHVVFETPIWKYCKTWLTIVF